MSEDTRSAWSVAHDRNVERVRNHPLFHKLVREVAVAEQPMGTPWHLRNSLTYASWRTRGNRLANTTGWERRAWKLSEQIAKDLNLLPDSPPSEGAAVAYVTARDNVRARLR